jgi:multimeric flavodoxin WrbA
MPTLLIVHHTPSPAVHTMFEAVLDGATDRQIEGVRVVSRAALGATAVDVLEADGYVLGTPANLGYMSGAMKHFFDQVYYPCLDSTVGRPYGSYLHGNDDTTGARRAIETITTGLRWRLAHEPVDVLGPPTREHLDALRDLGATVAAGLMLDAN